MYVKEFKSVGDLRKSLKKYFDFYNNERPHQSFNAQTPAEVYYGMNQLRMAG
ncbi:MAG: integrase core domain-containing protein [Desulfobacteraceae bacterium]|nr:integrase core domain-containing protein [Desulfobacteraceae bacterium]